MAAVIPCLRYRDAHKAIGWLCDVFGFERHLIVDGETAPSPTPSWRSMAP